MPIGAFPQRSGLTASALRFYADAALLRPAEVDPVSGYHYYRAEQLPRGMRTGSRRSPYGQGPTASALATASSKTSRNSSASSVFAS